MRMLSDDEIRRVVELAQTDTDDWMKKVEEDAIQKRQAAYKKAQNLYKLQMRMYETQLKGCKYSNEIFERNYQSGLAQWEKYEKEKAAVEEEYQAQLEEYEKLKKKREEAGEPFDQPPPQKKYLVPVGNPKKMEFQEPVPPSPPEMPAMDIPLTIPIQLSLLKKDKNHFSEAATQQLRKYGSITPENKALVCQIVFREMYILERLEMEKAAVNEDPISEGLLGEMLIIFELELCKCSGTNGTILHNIEIEVGNRTIQTDIIFITQKGVLVIESKNYSGKISGAEYMKKWVLQTPRRQYNFFNPIIQNQSHIHVLGNIIPNTKFYSLVIFSDRSYLDYIDIHCEDTFVFNLYALRDVIDDIITNDANTIAEQEIAVIADKLRRYCADDPDSNPDYKEPRSYFSSRSKAKPPKTDPYREFPPFQVDDFIIE